MKNGKQFPDKLRDGDFLVTAEYLPKAESDGSALKAALNSLREVPAAVNVSDNPFGVGMSSISAAVLLAQSGIEPIFQMVTRDRNRIAIQSDLLGAAALGLRTVLCLSGYHQTLTDQGESANAYDIDSTQMIALAALMSDRGELLNGARIGGGSLPMTIGAVANPYLMPLELNVLRLGQKVTSGARFIQTHAVFDVDGFSRWLEAVRAAGITDAAAILAGVLPLESAAEAEHLSGRYTDCMIPESVIRRLKEAGDADAQKKEGRAICVEVIAAVRNMPGVRGIHIHSGGKEDCLPMILSSSGLADKH